MTSVAVINVIKNNLNKMSLDELYKFQAKINTVQSQLQYPSGTIDVSFLKDMKTNDLENMVDNNLMVGNKVYWILREILLNSLIKGIINMDDFQEPNLKKIMMSDEFKKSLIKAMIDKKFIIQNGTSSSNKISTLLDIQEIIKTPIPSENTGVVYKSLVQNYEKVTEINQDLFDPIKKKRIIDTIFRNFGNILRQIDQTVQRQISIKSRGGGSSCGSCIKGGCACGFKMKAGGCGCGRVLEIASKMNKMNSRDLEKIKKQLGGGKLKMILDKCECGKKDIEELKKKL